MTNTGRYFVVDQRTGRRFIVEPIAERDQKIDGHVFTNGGLGGDDVKNDQRGGAIRPDESIITGPSVLLPPGVSPNGFIEELCRSGKRL